MPIREQTPKNPFNPYGASKLIVERVLSDELAYIALRYFNVYGADPESEIGELRDPETHLLPRAMMALQGHLSDFRVFGDDYATPDGTPIRHYIDVSDLADAHVASVQRLIQGEPSGAFNLGTGRGYSVKQVLEAIRAETGEPLEVGKGPRRPGDPAILVADAALACAELGLAHRSDLKTIIATAWARHRAHPKRGAFNGSGARQALRWQR